MKYWILTGLTLSAFTLSILGKKKIAMAMLFFFIPFYANPFRQEGYYFLMGINAFVVWGIWSGDFMCKVIQGERINVRTLSARSLALLYCLIVGVVLGLSNDRTAQFEFAYGHSLTQSLINCSLFIVTILLFLRITADYSRDYEFQDRLCLVLILTPFLQLGCLIVYLFGFNNALPSFLINVMHVEENFDRFAGLLIDYELIVDYSLIMISCALVLIVRGKYILTAILSILSSGVIGVFSGTRAFAAVTIVFSGLLLIIMIWRYGTSGRVFRLLLFGGASILVIGFICIEMFPEGPVFERLESSLWFFKKGDYKEAINRDILKALPIIINSSGIFGNGSMLISKIDDDWMVFHNVYLGIYANYGIVGLLLVGWLLGSSIYKLVALIRKGKDRQLSESALILLAMLLSLMMEQMKISALRMISIMLLYGFVFLIIDFNYQRVEGWRDDEARN
jgi:hypothetical protein